MLTKQLLHDSVYVGCFILTFYLAVIVETVVSWAGVSECSIKRFEDILLCNGQTTAEKHYYITITFLFRIKKEGGEK